MSAPRHWQVHPITAALRPPSAPQSTGNDEGADQLDRALPAVRSLPSGYFAARITVDANQAESTDSSESAGV